MNSSIHTNRLIFDRHCQEIAAPLPPPERTHLCSFLLALVDLAKANATTSLKKRSGKLCLLANHYKPNYINRVTQKTSRPSPDSRILAIALQLKEKHPNTPVILISRDTVMRVRARVLEIRAEDYRNARVTTEMYTGITETQNVPEPPLSPPLPPNHYIITPHKILRWNGKDSFIPVRGEKVLGVYAKTRHQTAFLDALLCPEITCITANGTAGTGKTLLALAAGPAQVEKKLYRKVIVARPTIPMGRDIGYLPGEAEEKTKPFLGPIWDNLTLLEETCPASLRKGQLPLAESLQKAGILEVGYSLTSAAAHSPIASSSWMRLKTSPPWKLKPSCHGQDREPRWCSPGT